MPGDAERQVTARVSKARVDAKTAASAVEAASKAKLDELLARSVAERFKAIETADPVLTPGHRRALLRSIRDGSESAPRTRATPISTASRWELFRSRLPYRVVPLAVAVMLATTTILLIVVARQRTPERWVALDRQQDLLASWRQPDGRIVDALVVAGRSYALMSRRGSDGTLRDWKSGQGYAETEVPLDMLRTAQAR